MGLLHGDPHPGNFKVLPDGRLGAVDFGLVARLPDGLPLEIGRTLRLAMSGDVASMEASLRREPILTQDIDPAVLMRYLTPFIEPAQVPEFSFDRSWMQAILRDAWQGHADQLGVRSGVQSAGRVRVAASGLDRRHRGPLSAPDPGQVCDVLDEFLPGFATEPA